MSTATYRTISAHSVAQDTRVTLPRTGGGFVVDCPDAETREFIQAGIAAGVPFCLSA